MTHRLPTAGDGVKPAATDLPQIPDGALFITTRETAGLLRMSPETVLRWHRSGKLPGGRRLSSNVLRFDRGEVEAWLETGGSLDEAETTAGVRLVSRSADGHDPARLRGLPATGRNVTGATVHTNPVAALLRKEARGHRL